MTITRRELLSAVPLAAALPLAQKARAKPRGSGSGNTVQFIFEGLCAAQFDEAKYTLNSRLMDYTKVKLPLHTPLMIMKYDDYLAPASMTTDDYEPPAVLPLNGTNFAIWNIDTYSIWVYDDDHKKFDNDTKANLVFPTKIAGTPTQPTPVNDDAAWEDRYWMVKLHDVVGKPVKVKHPDWLPTQVLLTRGTAKCLKPTLKCEQERLYSFDKLGCEEEAQKRAYTTRYGVDHPASGDKLTLAILPTSELSNASYEPQFIRVRVDAKAPVPVTITNLSHGHDASMKHFKEYYKLVDEAGPDVTLCGCKGYSAADDGHRKGNPPDSPNPFCIPPLI